MADIIVYAFMGWFAVGVLVALPFLALGVGKVVEGTRGSSPLFRLMILPGCVALWPFVLTRWVRMPK